MTRVSLVNKTCKHKHLVYQTDFSLHYPCFRWEKYLHHFRSRAGLIWITLTTVSSEGPQFSGRTLRASKISHTSLIYKRGKRQLQQHRYPWAVLALAPWVGQHVGLFLSLVEMSKYETCVIKSVLAWIFVISQLSDAVWLSHLHLF
jgi:hypothetical protein